MSKAKQFTITSARIKAAQKNAVINGVDFADKRNLPTTAAKARKLSIASDTVADNAGIALAAAHMIAIGEGTFSSKELLGLVLKGLTKSDIVTRDGSDADYTKAGRVKNMIIHNAVTGDWCNMTQAKNVDVKTGLLKAPKPKATPSRRVQGAGDLYKKKGGAMPSEALQANAHAAVTTDDEGNVIDIKQFTGKDIAKVMQPATMAAFIATLVNSQIICIQSNDADSKDIAFDDKERTLNSMLSELL